MKNNISYYTFLAVAMIYGLYTFWTYIDYSADEQAALINEAAGKEIACVDWIVSYPGRIVVACTEK